MADEFELTAEPRSDVGKGASRRLRRDAGLVPAIIYGAGKDPVMLSIPHKDIYRACQNEAFFSHIITIKTGKEAVKAIVKDLQRHPARDRIMHADFFRVSMDQAITVEVPFHFLNEETCIGVKQSGGIVAHVMSSVEVSCLPDDLPEHIEIDVENLDLGDSIHLSELTLPSGVEIPALQYGEDYDQVVVSINAPRKEEEIEPETEEAAEGEEETGADTDESESDEGSSDEDSDS
ncbi:MAG: 50S ribosomal protein L25/general stress protein Ctc [Pseudomonadales bacterium]